MSATRLKERAARPRTTWCYPRYPAIAVGLMMGLPGCRAGQPAPQPRGGSFTECKAALTSPASPQGLDDARQAPPFSADDPAHALGGPMVMGQSPAPYDDEMREGDAAQVEARITYCVRASRERHTIERATLTIDAWIRGDGSVTCARVHTRPEHADLSTCVRELVRAGRFESGLGVRRAAGTWTVGPEEKQEIGSATRRPGPNAR